MRQYRNRNVGKKESDKNTIQDTKTRNEIVMIVKPKPMKILDANYKKPNLRKVASSQTQLTRVQKKSFLKFLEWNKASFEEKCEQWNGTPVDFKLNHGSRPFAMRLYQIPYLLYGTT